jgi:hypothetical protein
MLSTELEAGVLWAMMVRPALLAQMVNMNGD